MTKYPGARIQKVRHLSAVPTAQAGKVTEAKRKAKSDKGTQAQRKNIF
jgi:hypothetical protein